MLRECLVLYRRIARVEIGVCVVSPPTDTQADDIGERYACNQTFSALIML